MLEGTVDIRGIFGSGGGGWAARRAVQDIWTSGWKLIEGRHWKAEALREDVLRCL